VYVMLRSRFLVCAALLAVYAAVQMSGVSASLYGPSSPVINLSVKDFSQVFDNHVWMVEFYGGLCLCVFLSVGVSLSVFPRVYVCLFVFLLVCVCVCVCVSVCWCMGLVFFCFVFFV
jgi:hypothetical protein